MNREPPAGINNGEGQSDPSARKQSILGLILLLIAIGLAVYFGRTYRLICNRLESGTVNCSGQVFFLNFLTIDTLKMVQHVEQAEREVSCQTNSQDLDYRCYLNTLNISGETGTIHISQDFLNEKTAHELIGKLRIFLKNSSQTDFEITIWNPAILLGGFLCVLPPFFIFGTLFLLNRTVTRMMTASTKQ